MFTWGSRVGVVVRVLAFHQCVPGSIPRPGVICGLSLLVLYSAPRGFSPGTPVFPSPQKPTFDLIWFISFTVSLIIIIIIIIIRYELNWFGTRTWPPFYCFGKPIYCCRDAMSKRSIARLIQWEPIEPAGRIRLFKINLTNCYFCRTRTERWTETKSSKSHLFQMTLITKETDIGDFRVTTRFCVKTSHENAFHLQDYFHANQY